MQLKERSEYIENIKKSKFIAVVMPISSINDAQNKIIKINKEHPNANHICYAYHFQEYTKSCDDHEPSGTAGIPILKALLGSKLENTLVCVIRYFGGIKLGSGGLIRAYSTMTSIALRKAPKIEFMEDYHFSIQYPYNCSKRIEAWLYQNKTHPIFKYNEQIYCEFNYSKKDILTKIQDLSSGQAELKLLKVNKKEKPI